MNKTMAEIDRMCRLIQHDPDPRLTMLKWGIRDYQEAQVIWGWWKSTSDDYYQFLIDARRAVLSINRALLREVSIVEGFEEEARQKLEIAKKLNAWYARRRSCISSVKGFPGDEHCRGVWMTYRPGPDARINDFQPE